MCASRIRASAASNSPTFPGRMDRLAKPWPHVDGSSLAGSLPDLRGTQTAVIPDPLDHARLSLSPLPPATEKAATPPYSGIAPDRPGGAPLVPPTRPTG